MTLAAATWPRDKPLADRLLRIDPRRGAWADGRVGDLPGLLRAGDLLVVNDAATLPASLPGTGPAGEAIEVRLIDQAQTKGQAQGGWQQARASQEGPGQGPPQGPPQDQGPDGARFSAVLFGAGDWRTRTEDRPAPAPLRTGDEVRFGAGLRARVAALSPLSPRLVELVFDRGGADLWAALYALGRPVQYAYLEAPLPLWLVQNAYAARPWAAEQPSAGRPLTWEVLLGLRRRGVRIATLTHAAGLSATGDPALDRALPLPERFDIPEETARAVRETRAAGGRIVAVGTSVVRALEGCAALCGGQVRALAGETDLVLHPGYRPRVVDGLLTGLHDPGASHWGLLRSFVDEALLGEAYRHAAATGYLCHEFGDTSLILPE